MPSVFKNYQLILLIFVLSIAIFFRFWQIRDYVVFLGDEGRDMIVMRDIFVDKRLPFLGPTASVGGFYLGPIYYWMAAPFLYLADFDPVGPAYFVAIIGVLTVFLLYKFLKEAVGYWPAMLASLLYATAPLVVRYSRSSWNPNPLPFFALLMMYLIYLAITKKKPLFFLGAGACFGIAVQLHYLASILVFVAGLIILINTNYKNWTKVTFFSTVGFLITFSPFLAFEIRHNFPNFRTILEFVTRGSNVGFKTFNIFWLTFDTGNIMLEEISRVMETIYTKIAFLLLSVLGFLALKMNWNNKQIRSLFLVSLIWFFGGILSLRLYTGQIYDYYFGSIFPSPFLLLGLVFYALWEKRIAKIAIVLSTIFILYVFLNNGFYKTPPNKILDQTQEIAQFVIDKTESKPYNFALISKSNSDHAYRYFLEVKNEKPTELETLITEQLIVVCESKKCEPLGDPGWEIAGFGRAEIANEWEFEKYGIKVYRLNHWQGAPSPAGRPAIKGG